MKILMDECVPWPKRRIAILELSTNDLRRILAAESSIIETIASIKSGDYLQLDIP